MASVSNAQMKALRVVPRVNATLSMLGSAYILFSVYNRKQQERPVLGRTLLMGMSLTDMFSSLAYVVGDAAFPEDKGGHGTQATCNAQAFIVHLQVGAALYSGFLAWCCCLYTRYHWRDNRIRKYHEPIAHLIVWLFVLVTGGIAVRKGLMNPHWIRCYIAGPNSNAYFWGFFYAPIWISMVFGTVAMILIYASVRQVEERSMRYRLDNQLATFSATTVMTPSLATIPERQQQQEQPPHQSKQLNDLPMTRRVGYQGLCYTTAFIFVYTFPTISRILMTVGVNPPPYPIRFLATATVSSQGFWNWVVYYVQPRVQDSLSRRKRKRRQQSKTRLVDHEPSVLEGVVEEG